jgi:hypothetical protein
MMGAPLLAVVSVLQMAQASSTVKELPAESSGVHFHVALELSAQAFPSGPQDGELDGMAVALPRLGVSGGEEFEFELGAPLRLRMLDQEPKQAELDYGGRLRREDWDEASDFGQILRHLRVGSGSTLFLLRAGNLGPWSVGSGLLVNRYYGRLSPDYHPASADLSAILGPVRLEAFASDVLARRLFAGEARLDIGRLTGMKQESYDRFYLLLAAAHDFGTGGGVTPAMSAAQLAVQAGLMKSERLQLWLQAAGGARADMLDEPVPDVGATLGLRAKSKLRENLALQGRLEGRHQEGGFRFGLFGPDYELARFSGVGHSFAPLAEELLPSHFSGYGEVQVELGAEGEEDVRLVASAAGQYFSFGRVDADLALSASLPGGRTQVELRAIATGVMNGPRYSLGAHVLHRFHPSLYAVASGGSLHFPQADGHLVRGVYAGLGVGVDFER